MVDAPFAQPAPSLHQRLPAIDMLRGIGVLGALFVSIWIFGGFSTQQQNNLLLLSKGANYRLYGLMQLLLTGKMIALIAMALGASMVIFLSKEHAPGHQPPFDVFVKKYLWLIVFGLFNGLVLLWSNDLLFALGIMAVLLMVFVRLSPKNLLMATLLMTVVFCAKNYWDYADDKKVYAKYLAVVALEKKHEKDSVAKAKKGIAAKKDTLTKLEAKDKEAWERLVAGKKVDLKKDDEDKKKMRSGAYTRVWDHQLSTTQAREAAWLYRKGVWDLGAMIFLGMLLYKIRFFSHRFSTRQYLMCALAGIGAGLLLGWWRLHTQQISLQGYEAFVKTHALPHTVWYPVEKAAMAFGYAALVLALLRTSFARLLYAFEAVGRLSLTNYLLQSLVCTIFFYGYGMGYYARLTQPQLYFFALELVVMQTIFSVLWLRRFNYGPAEWLWRRLSYGRWRPRSWRKSGDAQAAPILS